MATRTPPDLTRFVPLDYLQAIQTIMALEARAAEFDAYTRRGADVEFVGRLCRSAIAALREAFRIPSEAELDALHEATHAELDELREAEDDRRGHFPFHEYPHPDTHSHGLPDVPLADPTSPQLLRYQAEGR